MWMIDLPNPPPPPRPSFTSPPHNWYLDNLLGKLLMTWSFSVRKPCKIRSFAYKYRPIHKLLVKTFPSSSKVTNVVVYTYTILFPHIIQWFLGTFGNRRDGLSGPCSLFFPKTVSEPVTFWLKIDGAAREIKWKLVTQNVWSRTPRVNPFSVRESLNATSTGTNLLLCI